MNAGLCLALTVAVASAADQLVPLDLRDVKVQGEIGRRIDVTIRNNVLVLDAERDFLKPFEAQSEKGGYIGLGKLILASVRFAAYSGDARVVALKDKLIARLIATQGSDGYMGIVRGPDRVRALWDVHELGYLIAGLTSDWHYFRNQRSLAAARKAADYLIANWSRIPAGWVSETQVAEHVAVTGIERTLLELGRVTGEARYREFVVKRIAGWSLPIVIGRRPGIEGHIYAYMARSLAQLELLRSMPDAALAANADRAVEFLTRSNGMAITGAAGEWEIWTDDQDGRGALGETCATAYLLRVYDSLLRLRGESRYGDLMERTVYNTLFAAQSPDGRQIRYYSPLEGAREYHPGDTYCCPCNYRRIVAELPEFVYYRASAGIAVNLYAASEAKVGNVRIRQETAYPSDGRVALHVTPDRPVKFALKLRIPAWASGAAVAVNGGKPVPARAGAFFDVEREWRSGDVVRLEMPMPVRMVKGRERQAGRVALMRGPVVFCLNPLQEKTLASMDAADLTALTLDPASVEVMADDSVRTGGVGFRAGFWKAGHSLAAKPEMTLRLTEFADPNGRATYFRLRDRTGTVADELLGR